MASSNNTDAAAAAEINPSEVDDLRVTEQIQELSLDHDTDHDSEPDPGIERDSINSPIQQETIDGCCSDGSPPSSPKLSYVLETKSLLNMYSNVESRVVADMKQEDEYLTTLAEIKRDIARVERKLAHCRAKETLVLHRIQLLRQGLADKRNLQAEINVERIKTYQKRLRIEPRTVEQPEDIFTTLSRPSTIASKPLVA